jgi:hypothetical protein
MKSYVVRIYRDEKSCSGELLGTVERPGEDIKLAFTSFDELKHILGTHAVWNKNFDLNEEKKRQLPGQGKAGL